MIVREILVNSDALAVARRLAGRPGLAVLASPGGDAHGEGRFAFVACDPVGDSDAWVPGEHTEGARAKGWSGFPAGPRWIGVIPYEAGRDLERAAWRPSAAAAERAPQGSSVDPRPAPSIVRPRWLAYDAVLRIDRATGRAAIEADDDRAADRFIRALNVPAPPSMPVALRALPGEREEAHVERVREVLRYIARGDVYQVNLARCLELRATGAPIDVFTALFKHAPSSYGFFLDFGDVTVCGMSPELALEVRGEDIRTCPIKGTRPRGRDAQTDVELARELDNDPKERAELTMAIDLHRNDLGKVAVPGTVRVRGEPKVVRTRTVWSRVADIVAKRAPGVTLDDIARAVVPCGSVTGAPKVRAMEIIAELEPFRRGLYTGVYGYAGRDGGLAMAMAIRTLELSADGAARYCTGGGIVADSQPWRELEETRWKAQLPALSAAMGAQRSTTRNLAEPRV